MKKYSYGWVERFEANGEGLGFIAKLWFGLSRILKHIGCMPGIKWLLPLILVTGFAEGVGLSALLPVVTSLLHSKNAIHLAPPFNYLPNFFLYLGINPTFSHMLIATLFLMILSFLLVYFQQRAIFSLRFKLVASLRNRLSTAVFESKWENITRLSSGSTSNFITNETDRGAEGLSGLIIMLASSIQFLIYGVIAFQLSAKMFSIAFVTILIALLFGKRLLKIVRKLGKQSTEVNSEYSRELVDYMRVIKLIKAMALESPILSILSGRNKQVCQVREGIVSNQIMLTFQMQAMISVALVTILYSSVVIFHVAVSSLLVFMLIVIRFLPKFSVVQGQYHNFAAYVPSLETVYKQISDYEKCQEDFNLSGLKFQSIEREVRLDNVSYTHPGCDKPTLSQINISIPAKKFIAIVGKTGSGKSTILDILMGVIKPEQGTVNVDGVNLSEYNMHSYRQQIGFVSQDTSLFTGSVRNNVCVYKEYSDKLVWDALKIAQIDQFIRELPEQLESEAGENGVRFSGGQKQRIAIARALMRHPKLLILDEATSALDGVSEKAFQKALEAVSNYYTIVCVAHRLSTIRKADVIYVIDKGRVVEQGTYDQLRKENAIFNDFLESQNMSV